MWFPEIAFEIRSPRYDSVEIEIGMGGEVMYLDVVHVDALSEAMRLVEVSAVVEEVGVLAYLLFVTFKVGHVDLVEAKEGCEQFNIRKCNLVSAKEASAAKMVFCFIEVLEQLIAGFVIGFLIAREPTSVDSVINKLVDPRVDFGHEGLELFRAQIDFRVLCEIIELSIQHHYYFS